MAQPVLVRAYTSRPTPVGSPSGRGRTLPPISAFTFADILRAADSADFQEAINGIAEICAKNRMSLAEEHTSHMPPVGEITEPVQVGGPARTPHARRPNAKRALTSVPEASSSGSEGSKKAGRMSIFAFGAKKEVLTRPKRAVRIGSMGRTVSVASTIYMSQVTTDSVPSKRARQSHESPASEAAASLQRVLQVRNTLPG